MPRVIRIPLSSLVEMPGNVNRMDEPEFNMLCEGIKDSGVIPPIVVAPRGGKFVIIDGNHRKQAAEVLDWGELDCLVLDDLTEEDAQAIISARMNTVRGHVDRDAFTRLWVKVRARLEEHDAMRVLGISSESHLKKLVRTDVRRIDSAVMVKDEIAEMVKRAGLVQDLAIIIRTVIGDGGLSEFGYVVFQLRGANIVLVRCSQAEMERIRLGVDRVKEAGISLSVALIRGLELLFGNL